MSRSWRATRLIAAADLFGGRLEKYGVREKVIEPFHPWETVDGQEPLLPKPPDGDPRPKIPGTTERNRFPTDGTNVMSVIISERGSVFDITRYGDTDCNGILRAIDQEFEAGLVDEDDPWNAYRPRPWDDSGTKGPADNDDESDVDLDDDENDA
jgi:hypothetical protein